MLFIKRLLAILRFDFNAYMLSLRADAAVPSRLLDAMVAAARRAQTSPMILPWFRAGMPPVMARIRADIAIGDRGVMMMEGSTSWYPGMLQVARRGPIADAVFLDWAAHVARDIGWRPRDTARGEARADVGRTPA